MHAAGVLFVARTFKTFPTLHASHVYNVFCMCKMIAARPVMRSTVMYLLLKCLVLWNFHFRCCKNAVHSLNNYWMRLSVISWIIKAEVCVTCRSRRLRQITQTRGFDNSWYRAKTEFNNYFIIHFSHNSSSETEAKRSAILFLRKTRQGA